MRSDKTSFGRLPEFIIIGAQKSGTTTLHKYLCLHPDIYMCPIKEPHFFSYSKVRSRGISWYKQLFRGAKSNQICGEASSTYSQWPNYGDVVSRIAQVVPEAKLIYIMRNPVDRAYSAYSHQMRAGVTMTFEEALEHKSEYVDLGHYMIQIKQYLKLFKPEAFKFLLLDDLQNNPNKVLQEIQDFLGVNICNLLHKGEVWENKAGAENYLWFRIMGVINKSSVLMRVKNFIPPNIRRKIFSGISCLPISRKVMNSYQLPPMKPETRERLLDVFQKPNDELSAFLGRDISLWSK